MATTTWYGDGTATVAVGSRTVTGDDTGWLTEVAGLTPIKVGDKFGIHVGRPIVIEQIISDTELLLADDWPGPAQTDAPYKVELTPPTIAAVEAMRRLLASLSNGNLDSLSEITVGVDDIPVGLGPGVFGTVKKSALVNGVEFDVQVDTLADRAAYNAQAEGFKVLVSDVGDGRAALYSKNSATSGDWSDPSYITGIAGPAGPYTEITIGPTTTLPAGSSATVTPVVIDADTVRLDFGLPKGADGSGTGDVVGPAGGVAAGDYAVFLDTTGKVIGKATNPPGGQNDAILALEIADLEGSRLGMKGGVADAFDDETGVDVKTNAVYDVANDWYKPSIVTTSVQLNAPASTAPAVDATYLDRTHDIPNNRTIQSLGVYSTTARTFSVKILRQNSTTNFDVLLSVSVSHAGGGWQDVLLPTPFVVPASGTYNMASFTTGGTPNVTASIARSTINSDATGSALTFTANTGVVHPMRYAYGANYDNMTLRSIAYAAAAVPTTGRLAVQLVETDAITINTDLIARISRDGGTTWATAALSLTQSLIGPKMYEANGISLASLGSGTSMKWEIATANNKNVAVSGVVAQWS